MRFGFSVIMVVALLCGVVGFQAQAQTRAKVVKESDASSWKELSPKEGKFSISLPGAPTPSVRTMDTQIGKVTTHSFTVEGDLGIYYVAYVDFPVWPETPEEIRAGLDSSRDQAVKGGYLISENDVSLGDFLGREIMVKKDNLILHARYFFAKGRLFQAILTSAPQIVFKEGEPTTNPSDFTDHYRQASKKFFESFKLTHCPCE